MASAGDATTDAPAFAAPRALRPAAPGEGEAVLWEGTPDSRTRRLLETLAFLLILGLLTWLAVELIRPHFAGSAFAGEPNAASLPLVLAMVVGTVSIIALPVWLRSSARGRARYMLTNRRALVWLGSRIVGEAILFGAEMEASDASVQFAASGLWLDWRLRDEGADRIRFERIDGAMAVAALAEEHGARWMNRPPEPDEPSGSS